MVEANQITKISDLELLINLCSSSDDDKLYPEFVKRFLPEIKEECLKICNKRKLDKHVGIDIAHKTFERVRKYKSFKTDEINKPNTRKGILVYLFRVSTRLFNDHYRKQKKDEEFVNHKTYFENIFDPEIIQHNPAKLKQIKDQSLQIFNQLNNKEQAVVLADIEYKKFHKYLPDDVNESLAVELGVKKDTLRKIRERAIIKIKNAINEISQ